MERLFVYGTLRDILDVDIMLEDMPDHSMEMLPGNKEVMVGKYPNLIISPYNKVRGIVWYLTPEQLSKLDNWEENYKRIPVVLGSGKKAWTYVLKE